MGVSVRISEEYASRLEAILFPGDSDEHGAVLAASVLATPTGTRLLVHKIFEARDGVDYVEGQRGYKMLTASFVARCALECGELGMAYIAVHCHGGRGSVRFSSTDLESHERGYGALLDIVNGPPVGALVFAEGAVAGDIWFPNGERHELDNLVIAGRPIRVIGDGRQTGTSARDERFDRQVRLLGDQGQHMLRQHKIGVIGAGGAGSLVAEYLARLGVGEIVVVDPDRIDPSNLSRVVGSKVKDVLPRLTSDRVLRTVRNFFESRRTLKVRIAKREARRSGLPTKVQGIAQSIARAEAAIALVDCDYVFLAADSMQARLVFNALVHQYLIPGVQMGVKARIDEVTGAVDELFAVVRPLVPGGGCLWCNGLILPARLQEEALAPGQLRRQKYVDDPDVHAPSVVSMNAIAASYAVNDYLLTTTGLLASTGLKWSKVFPMSGSIRDSAVNDLPRRDAGCSECSTIGRLGRGPTAPLPVSSRG